MKDMRRQRRERRGLRTAEENPHFEEDLPEDHRRGRSAWQDGGRPKKDDATDGDGEKEARIQEAPLD